MNEFGIQVVGLSKSYEKKLAVNNLSLQVNFGEVVGLIGPNGSGKTTTLSILTGLRHPTSGTVKIDNHDMVTQPTKAKKSMGFVPDNLEAIDNLTGWEYVNLTAALYGLSNQSIHQHAQELFKIFGMESFQHQPVETYSHGMLKKIQLIAALIHQPKVYILDEPTSGLDIESILLFKSIVKKIRKKGGAVLLATHYLSLAEELCDRVYMVKDGICIAQGSPITIRSDQCVTTLEEAFIKLAIGQSNHEEMINEILDYF
jgi:ABC-2 type transport system ATP-binding protein